jgi:hypothetical protein
MIHEYRSDLTAIEADVLKRAMVEGHEFGIGPSQGAISNACSDGLDESLETRAGQANMRPDRRPS